MKYLLRHITLRGGAPRSLLQYMKVLTKDGSTADVIAQRGDPELDRLYEESFGALIPGEDPGVLFFEKKLFRLMLLLHREYRALKKNRPDMVIAVGHFNAYFYSYFCGRLRIPNFCVIAGGDLSSAETFVKDWACCRVICFSEENREVIMKYYPAERIRVISNRIDAGRSFDDMTAHYADVSGTLRVLFTSRLDADKADSIRGFMASLAEACREKKIPAELRVAGDGSGMEALKDYAASLESEYFRTTFLGRLEKLRDEFAAAHLVCGKGRSVIEPIMLGRVGAVISDDGTATECVPENFEKLYHYNFSGRDSGSLKKTPVAELIGKIYFHTVDTAVYARFSELVREKYDAAFLEEKLIEAVKDLGVPEKKVRFVNCPLLVLKMVFRYLQLKLRK